MAKFCRSNVRCYKCKVVGNHHTVFCRGDVKGKDEQSQENVIDGQEEITTSCIVNEKKSVLLQTAVCNLIGNNDRTVAVKALFDCGSQQTYIANRLVKPLNLEPVRDINMQVKTFGADPQNLRAKEYLIKLQSSTGDVIPIQAISKTCDKISGQIVKKAVKRHPFIQKLKLADDGTHPDVDIEL